MPQDLFRLPEIVDHFPEPVFFIDESRILYSNPAARKTFPDFGAQIPPVFFEPLRRLGYEGQLVMPQGNYLVTSSKSENGRIMILRRAFESDSPEFGVTSNLPAQLRRNLNTLSASIEQLRTVHDSALIQKLMAVQSQTLHRLLRLTRQLELSGEDALQTFPLDTMDLTSLCQNISQDLQGRLNEEGPSFRPVIAAQPLLISGSFELLEQLALSLLSNAIKSCGAQGAFGLRLAEKNQRAVLSIWDDGRGIPHNRMTQLFSPKHQHPLPMPSDGSGLDLWIAHRITLLHGGVIVAGNHPEGGAEFTVSFPLDAAEHLRLRSRDQLFPVEDLSPLLIALSDVLPARLYGNIWEA